MERTSTVVVVAAALMLSCTTLGAVATNTRPAASPTTPGVPKTRPPGAQLLDPIPLHIGHAARGHWFEVYFTDPSDPASPQATGGIDGELVGAIDAAHLSVHAALYSLTLDDVRQALIRAHRRGVDVRLVMESDNLDADDPQRLKSAGIPVLGDRRQGTMHDKFMVIDGIEVWTGSMNLTVSGVYRDNNNMIRLRSAELAEDFESEFDEMFEDDRFGPDPGQPTPHPQVQESGTLVEVYFSPDDGVEEHLVQLLDTASSSVRFLAFSFTSDALGAAVIRAAEAGLIVSGVMDLDQANSNVGTELTSFRLADLDVRLDGNPDQMHHKVLIIDDEIVVLGSYNFSRSANETNDENVLVVHSPGLAQQYLAEFDRIYGQATP
jgi:phosphatidylserine/phosphatidylglycerophosphate/cardiolipin synthase-like enzyme